MLDRISLILRTKNISAAQFADKIDVQRSSVSHVLSGRNKPSLEFIQKILRSYPEIGPNWLLFGNGPMLLEENDLFTAPENVRQNGAEIRAGFLEMEEKPDDLNQGKPKDLVSSPKSQDIDSDESTFSDDDSLLTDINSDQSMKHIKAIENSANVTRKDGIVKKAEKIVIFFDDNSFSIYYPENK